MCLGGLFIIADICRQVVSGLLSRVTATIESVGAPSDLNLAAGLGVGRLIITLPMKIKLDNTFLAPTGTSARTPARSC